MGTPSTRGSRVTITFDTPPGIYTAFLSGKAIQLLGTNGRYGLVNRIGQIAVPLKYETLRFIGKNEMIAKREGQFGGIDTLGTELLAFAYEGIDDFEPDSVALVKLDGLIRVPKLE